MSHIQRLFTAALGKANGDRKDPQVAGVVDASIERLVATYIEHPEDHQNRTLIVRLLGEMEDQRALPALKAALDWKQELNEEHAVVAAQTLRRLSIGDQQKGEVIAALSDALGRVSGGRPVDNRMREAFMLTLGSLGDSRGSPALVRAATTSRAEQHFAFNRLALEQLARLSDPRAVPALLKALFLHAPSNPQLRANDVAAEALVRVGKPALQPTIDAMEGKNKEVAAAAKAYVSAVARAQKDVPSAGMEEVVLSAELGYVLGELGFAAALPVLVKETNSSNALRRMNGSIALSRLILPESQSEVVRTQLENAFESAEEPEHQAQVIAAMRHTYDAYFMPFYLARIAEVEERHAIVRLAAFEAAALLADRREALELKKWIKSARHDPYRVKFEKEYAEALKTASECGRKAACWQEKLRDANQVVARKAAYMVGRLGALSPSTESALVEQLGNSSLELRVAALSALDRAALKGSPKAEKRIDELAATEEGREIWKNFKPVARRLQARLRARTN